MAAESNTRPYSTQDEGGGEAPAHLEESEEGEEVTVAATASIPSPGRTPRQRLLRWATWRSEYEGGPPIPLSAPCHLRVEGEYAGRPRRCFDLPGSYDMNVLAVVDGSRLGSLSLYCWLSSDPKDDQRRGVRTRPFTERASHT